MSVSVVNRQRSRRVPRQGLSTFLRRADRLVAAGRGGELTVCLVSDRKMRELSRVYRGRDAPTDVLSFPAGGDESEPGRRYLGDIAVSVETAARQARQRGHALAVELKILVLHGYLHLLGLDHETDDGQMMRLQRRLERRLLDPGWPGKRR
ncbi:MAG TPA: rRNA maturation RNase YbeY [Candidatus Polarisedimenticolaceae bacterium]|nr:rRNA maturation RNase YbeY [Candidatus Polarisedimenticolaceae bacterium]